MIRCYTGLLGGGKTYSMVEAARLKVCADPELMVYTNMAGLRFPEAAAFGDLEDIMGLRAGLILLDEGSVVLSSRYWQDVGRHILTRFAQLRKHGLDLWYTAQDEARVDTVLREITNEFVRCRKMGGIVHQVTEVPGSAARKGRGRMGWARLRPETFSLYDTLEVITTDGGSAGRANLEVPLSLRAARKRSGTARGEADGSYPGPPLTYENGWTGEVEYSGEARAALAHLRRTADWVPAADPRQQVWLEVQRRRWLRQFRLTALDVPPGCTQWNPWLEGFDPASAQERKRERDMAAAAQVLIDGGRRRGSREKGTISFAA